MIIYEWIFERILQPFVGMWDDDEYVKKIEAIETLEEAACFIRNGIIESFKDRGINYLNSRNVQATLYYYMNCAGSERINDICSYDLIPLPDDAICLAFKEIYDAITTNIGALNMTCADFTESEEINPPHLYYLKDIVAYMSK